jgi:hypothetical protein
MAGTVVATQSLVSRGLAALSGNFAQANQVVKTSLLWTSDASGVVSANSVTLPSGMILLVTFTPGAGGVQPTDLYDVTMTCNDHPAVNIFDDGTGSASIGANLSNANASHKVPFQGGGSVSYYKHWIHGGGNTLVIANAGNAKQGTIDIYIAPGF